MRHWSNLDARLDVWKIIEEEDDEKDLNEKASKLYEVLTILSALCCGSLIGLSNTNNDNENIILAYDIIKGYGIITSIFCSVISVTYCALIQASSNKNTFYFLKKTNRFSNIPFFGIIFSLICLTICSSLHFKIYIMTATLPYGCFVIFYSFYFYNCLHNTIHTIVQTNKKKNKTFIDPL